MIILRAVLIDDEVLAISLLEKLLLDIGGVQIAGKFTNPNASMELIKDLNPDIIFLDIEMPNANGIEVAERLSQYGMDADIVFVTAYNQYALDAFNVHALDYVLKPVERDRLRRTIEMILKRRRTYTSSVPYNDGFRARFMGHFELYDAQGQPLKWRTRKVKELCAYLLHHAAPMHRSQIIEDLWPQESLEKASILLHTSIYKLRKELKIQGNDNPIIYQDERYSIRIDQTSDVESLLEAINFFKPNKESLVKLLDLYRNDYLDGEDYHWSIPHKEKIKEKFKRLLEGAAFRHDNGLARPDYFKDIMDKLLEMDPFQERYSRELISYYLQSGAERQAAEVYLRLKEQLWAEMGETPETETEELIHSYLV
ncbi:response regulator [Paenibacillus abyssi]|uniref:Response regulatory domain-containing protein n=1 Tax=Paenibacillus abyssi TaxID=1340531 RepID=A0A917G556_9BACL|nr:response regulator [Paenibacillus abyssi]GGG22286.1 hypothetical protein GCM10010916_43680 [Paenibacillus abyssi]